MYDLLPRFGVVPHSGVPYLRFESYAASRATCIAAMLVNKRTEKGKTLNVTMADDWQRRHTPYKWIENNKHSIPKEARADEKRWRSSRAGIDLVHTRAGRMLYTLRNSYLRVCKQLFPRKSVLEAELTNGGVFALLRTVPTLPTNPVVDLELPDIMCGHLFHIGLQYLSPYRPTCQPMNATHVSGRMVNLEATSQFHTLYDVLDDVIWDGDEFVLLSILSLKRRNRPLGQIDPKYILAEVILLKGFNWWVVVGPRAKPDACGEEPDEACDNDSDEASV